MPLPLPNLDDRRWADLMEEGRALITRYVPVWTDHNIHDPGITLLELFAWLSEMTVYRLNRVPTSHRRKFLGLTGITPRPPRAARTVLSFDPDAGTRAFSVPAGAEFEASRGDTESIRFHTVRDLTVADVTLAAVKVKTIGTDGKHYLLDRTQDWRDGLPFALFGEHPQSGAALYLGFSTLPSATPVALAFHLQGPGTGAEERERIIQEVAAQRAACRPILPDIPCEEEGSRPAELVDTLPAHHSAQVVWEVSTTGDTWTRLKPVANGTWPDVLQVMDDTRSLTLDGIVEVNVPDTVSQTKLSEEDDASFYYLRCRLVSGAYDAPPTVLDVAPNSVISEQALPVWQTFSIAADAALSGPNPMSGQTTRLNMRLNASNVIETLAFLAPDDAPEHPSLRVLNYAVSKDGIPERMTLELALLGTGDGRPNQQVVLPQAPVQVESFQLYTHTGRAWQAWTRQDDLDASVRTDYHFVLDAMSGVITFGDGEQGRVAPEDAYVLAVYHATRANAGNVAANTVTRPAATPRNALWLAGLDKDLKTEVKGQLPRIITNLMLARGGTAAESLAEATGRAVEMLHAHERLLDLCAASKCQTLDELNRQDVQGLRPPSRAVSQLDIERLALDVPGTRVARARAWAGTHPVHPCLRAPGVVTLVIVPDTPTPKPEPSPGLLEAVKRYLDRRRMVTTRLEVVGPQYLEVRVSVRVRTRPHTDAVRVQDHIRQRLDTFLDPRRGGADGQGWPFGRDVYRTEILQQIDGVPGVDYVLDLTLTAGASEPQCGNVSVCPTWLVTPGAHQIDFT